MTRPLLMGYDNHIQNGLHDYRGAYKCSGFQGETRQIGQSRLEQTEQGVKWHKWWTTYGTSEAPLRRPGILKLHI
jgi:hypothetical protein